MVEAGGKVAWTDLLDNPGTTMGSWPVYPVGGAIDYKCILHPNQVVEAGGKVAWTDLIDNPGILASVPF